MKNLIFHPLFWSFFYLNSFGQDFVQDQIQKQLSEGFKKIEKFYSTDCQKCTSEIKQSGISPAVDWFNECIKKICPNNQLTVSEFGEAEGQQTKQAIDRFMKNVVPTVLKLNRLQSEVEQIQGKKVIDWVKTKPTLGAFETVFFNLVKYLQMIDRHRFEPNISFENLKFDHPYFQKKEMGNYKYLLRYYKQLALPFKTSDPKAIITEFGETEAKIRIEHLINEIAVMMKKINLNSNLGFIYNHPGFKEEFQDLEALKLRLESNRIGTADIQRIVGLHQVYKIFLYALDDKEMFTNLSQKKYDAKDFDLSSDELKSFNYKIDDKYSLSDFEPHQNCGILMNQIFYSTPTQKQIDLFSKNLPALISKLISSLDGEISSRSMEVLKEASKSWKLIMPTSQENILQFLKRDFEENLRSLEQNKDHFNTYPIGLTRALALKNIKDRQVRDKASSSICKNFLAKPINDFAKQGQILVSPTTVRFKEQQTAILHELSHLISETLESTETSDESKKWLAQTKKCLNESHGDKINTAQAEEDFADMLAYSLESKDSSFICSTYKIESSLKYSSLNFYGNSKEDQTHSEFIYRLLHSAKVRGLDMGFECKQLLRFPWYKPFRHIKNCLKSKDRKSIQQ